MNKEYKIYCLKDPNTDEIRYIGITTQKHLSSRLSQHYCFANKNGQTRVAKWIRKIGKKPVIELIEICDENNWEDREIYWIKYYDNLTNISKGGKGVVLNKSLSSIERSSKAHEIKIVQLDMKGDFIKIWNSVKEASNFFNAKSLSSISNVLNKRVSSAFKYRWVYYENYINQTYVLREKKPNVNYNKLNKVYLYDLNFNLINEYKCLNLVLKDIKIGYTSLKKALNRKTPFFNKYYIRDYKI